MTDEKTELQITTFQDVEPRLYQGPRTGNIVLDLGEDFAYVKIVRPMLMIFLGTETPISIEYGKLYPWRKFRNKGVKYEGPIDAAMRAEIARWV